MAEKIVASASEIGNPAINNPRSWLGATTTISIAFNAAFLAYMHGSGRVSLHAALLNMAGALLLSAAGLAWFRWRGRGDREHGGHTKDLP